MLHVLLDNLGSKFLKRKTKMNTKCVKIALNTEKWIIETDLPLCYFYIVSACAINSNVFSIDLNQLAQEFLWLNHPVSCHLK
jgi:hypothetical protein